MTKIKNLIFDFGGVLLDLDYQKTFDAFGQLLNQPITRDNADEIMGSCLQEFERGEMNNETFIWNIQHLKQGNIEPVAIIRAYNAMLLGIRPEIFPFLKDLRKEYKVFLLSNTNALHIRYVMQNILEKQYGIRDWNAYFDGVYYSHEMGMRKPDAEIYETLVQKENLDPNASIFIDDLQENVSAAMLCGLHAVQHDPALKIEEKIQEYIDACGAL